MNISAIRRLRAKLAQDEAVYGLWITLESAGIAEMAVALGLDWIVVDAEHGHLDWRDIAAHLRAAVRSDTVALVRIAEMNAGLIKRVLDIGADGVVVPWVETTEQLRQAVAYAKYPPEGMRGIGAERATAWGQALAEHAAEANDHVLVVPIIETVRGGRSIGQLLGVPGTELFFFGPADYSSTAGFPGQWEGPGVAEQLRGVLSAVRAAGKHGGIVTGSAEDLARRRDEGFRMLGLGIDSGLLIGGLKDRLHTIGRNPQVKSDLSRPPARE